MAEHPTSLRVYRTLLRLYPANFRDRYGGEMVQLLGDQLRDARNSGRLSSLVVTWFRSLDDLITTSLSERLAPSLGPQSLGPAPSRLTRTLGLAGIAGGAVLIASFVGFLWPSNDVFNARLIVLNVGSITIATALARRWTAGRSKLVLATAMAVVVVNLVHLVLIARIVAQPGEPGFGSYPPPYGRVLQAMWLTGAAFGIVSLVRRVGSRPGSVSLVVGSAIAFAMTLDVPFNDTIRTVALSGVGLAGLGWVLFGIDVATRRRPLEIAFPPGDKS
jgi:hypothetical protein